MAIKGHSVTFGYGNQSTYQASTTFTDVAGVVEITPPKVSADDIDVSHMTTPDQFKDFDPGWAAGGEVELTIQFDTEQNEDVYALFRVKKGFCIAFVNGSRWLLTGYINEFGDEPDREDIVTTKIKIKVSGKPEFQKAPPTP